MMEENVELELMRRFPLISLLDDGPGGGKICSGFLTFEGTLIRIYLQIPNYPSTEGVRLEGDSDTWDFFHLHQNEIESILKMEDVPLLDLLTLLQKLTERILSDEGELSLDARGPLFYSGLVMELEEIGLEKITYVSKDYSQIHIRHTDPSSREHLLKCKLPNRYPHIESKIFAEIPQTDSEIIWPQKISQVYQLFIKNIERFELFWTEMDTIDAKVNVIDPINPNKAHKYRRIVLQNKVILYISIDCDNPRGYPTELKFNGPVKYVEELETLIEKNCQKWTNSKSVLSNLEILLEQEIPAKKEENDFDSDENNCEICYTFDFDGDIPDNECICGSFYHNKCLAQLLISDTNSKVKRKNVIQCPKQGCLKELRVKVSRLA